MDSTEISVYGQQEQSAYNGHFESTCYHPLLLFNREGDCLAAKLRPGNVHSAEGWKELLLPEIERQQQQGKEVAFRADAAFAKPEIYKALGTEHYGAVDPPSGKAELQAGGLVQELSLPGGQLADGAAGGGEGRVSRWGVVSLSGLYRHQPHGGEPRGGALLQQTGHGGAVDQRRQAGGEDDAAFLSPLPRQ